MWKDAGSAPLDGTPVVWLHRDGSGAQLMMYVCGFWWELDEECEGITPYSTHEHSMMDGRVWCALPSGMLVNAVRGSAGQYQRIIERHHCINPIRPAMAVRSQ